MAKPWAKYEVDFINHPKFRALTGNAICLWLEGKNYCDHHMTDGLIPTHIVKQFRFSRRLAIEALLVSCGQKSESLTYAPLWEVHAIGYRMHDYLEHNDCREEVLERIGKADADRDWEKRRKRLIRDPELTAAIRARDMNCCRYCGRDVNWNDRRGVDGGTYDHVHPRGDNSMENVVIACRGCNAVKGSRTPEEAGMRLRTVTVSGRDLAGSGRGQIVGVSPSDECRLSSETTSESEAAKNTKEQVISPEPLRDSTPTVLDFVTVGKSAHWALTQLRIDAWARAYPNIEVLAECRKAGAWIDANPERRKTAKGMPAFLVNWLNRAVNGPRTGSVASPAGKGPQWLQNAQARRSAG